MDEINDGYEERLSEYEGDLFECVRCGDKSPDEGICYGCKETS